MIDRKKLDLMEENGGAAALKYRDELGAELQATVNDTLQAVNDYHKRAYRWHWRRPAWDRGWCR